MTYLAHSARDGYPEQSYQEHIENVQRGACHNAEEAARYAVLDGETLYASVEMASPVHDMGKLNKENQEVLHQRDNHVRLPLHHQDAGVTFLKKIQKDFLYPQLAVSAHHSGLPDIDQEGRRQENCFRDQNKEMRDKVNMEIDTLAALHQQLIGGEISTFRANSVCGDKGVFFRIMLSCLVDADHTDTARHYRKFPQEQDVSIPKLRAKERLQRLDEYVSGLGDKSKRSKLRTEMYRVCRDSTIKENIVACNSPVGSAKTTALMAYALQQAISRKSRRIFVVLPFTNIIMQSVEVYREALRLPGENPEDVVAELHHCADFESEEVRALTAQWKAPIVVTTAVAFFETMASCKPATLRRLHELPGSVIFVDEAHAALPVKLLPTAWHWMQVLADEWSCHWILASGSLVEFWKLEEIWKLEELSETQRTVPQIVNMELRNRLMQYETNRLKFLYKPEPLDREQLVKWVACVPGPRLVIMNTVQSAAVIAEDMRAYYDEGQACKVMHLSSALEAEHRDKTIQDVRARLKDKNDTDWTLVATSCVEAGVEFSFKTGFREMASLVSLLQAAGRVNRNGLEDDAVIWTFEMQKDAMLTYNKGIKESSYVLRRYFQKGVSISPELGTKSMRAELRRQTVSDDARYLLEAETFLRFPEVQENFRVIDDNTVLVVADSALKEQLRYGCCDWKTIQRKAVSVRRYKVEQLHLQPLIDGVYDWTLGYDDFLGIMRGILSYQQSKAGPQEI
ncbi:MAG TPA: CRISPR-associated protein [Candidatus Pelethocola excrementipullorum]|nr:CRISPR-associated protein [Candidatus Pelethocola excrementipullorum]